MAMAKTVNRAGCTRWDERNTLATRTRLYTHEGREHRWKQSGIRGDARPVTQEEGQVIWKERRVAFQNKTWISQDTKPNHRTSLTAVWQSARCFMFFLTPHVCADSLSPARAASLALSPPAWPSPLFSAGNHTISIVCLENIGEFITWE